MDSYRSKCDNRHQRGALCDHGQAVNGGARSQFGYARRILGQIAAILLEARRADFELSPQIREISDVVAERLGKAARAEACATAGGPEHGGLERQEHVDVRAV